MKKILLCVIICTCTLMGCAPTAIAQDNQLVVAVTTEPEEGFDPCVGWGRDGNPLVQSTLLSTDAQMNFVYDLATDYFASEDGLSWTFTIRDDAQFSNGESVTAHDVAFTFETAKNSASVIDLTALNHITVIDTQTLVFELSRPEITFLYTIAQTGIVPANSYDETYSENPIGSGPFTLLQWNKGEQVIFGVNEYYYGQKPSFQRVTVLFMSEETAHAAAMRGDVDVAVTNMNLASTEIEGMKLVSFDTIDNRGITLPTIPMTGDMNTFNYPIGNDVTSDQSIRQALAYGIDRQKLVDDCLNGFGSVAYSECDGMPWSSESSIVPYDLDFANALLDTSGWSLHSDGYRYKNELKAEFKLLYNASDSTRQALSMAVASQAKKLGIHIIVEGTSWDEIDKQMHSSAVLMGWGSQNPMETYLLYHSSNKGLNYYNPEYYQNDIVDSHLEHALSQTDYNKFLQSYQMVQWDGTTGVSPQGDSPFVWLVNVDHLYFVNENLDLGHQKIHPHGHSWPIFTNLNEWTYNES